RRWTVGRRHGRIAQRRHLLLQPVGERLHVSPDVFYAELMNVLERYRKRGTNGISDRSEFVISGGVVRAFVGPGRSVGRVAGENVILEILGLSPAVLRRLHHFALQLFADV